MRAQDRPRRAEKTAIVEEIRSRIDRGSFLILAEYRGMKVEQLNALRRKLRGTGAEVHVYKNRMIRVVTRERGWGGLDTALRGQSAMVTGGDVVQTAKALQQYAAETSGRPAVRGGVLGRAVLSASDVSALAALPAREVLLAQMVGTVAAPLSRLVGVMQQKLSSLVYVLKAVEEKKAAKPA
jgi:large subunit ribosomal protein L10